MTEEQKNIIFVQVIQKYPCIYDCTREDYSKRDICEKAWSSVAKEVNDTVVNCKEKWKNLRTAFARSMKKPMPGIDTNKRKNNNYYLKDVMQFVLPYLKTRYSKANAPSVDNENSPNINTIPEISIHEENTRSSHDDTNENVDANIDSNFCLVKPPERKKRNKDISDQVDKCFMNYLNYQMKNEPSENRSDHDFLKSLLPEMSMMNNRQKMFFKMRTLETISSILYDD